MKVRVRRPADEYIIRALNFGMARNVPVGVALYLKRHNDLRDMIHVIPVSRNNFQVSLGKQSFRFEGNYGKYSIFELGGKEWRNLF